jgi:hypothetical protein
VLLGEPGAKDRLNRGGKLARANFIPKRLASNPEELSELCKCVESISGRLTVSPAVAIAIVVGGFAARLTPSRGRSTGLTTLRHRAACNGTLGASPGSLQVSDGSKLWVSRIFYIAKGGTAPTSESGRILRGRNIQGIYCRDDRLGKPMLFHAQPSCQNLEQCRYVGGDKGENGHRHEYHDYSGKRVRSRWRQ